MKSKFIFAVLLIGPVFGAIRAQNIITIAGNGKKGYSGDGGPAISASLNAPQGLAIDRSGNLYIGDVSNCVRKVNASTGTITTVAGNGKAGYSGDGGPGNSASLNAPFGIALDGLGNLYIADCNNHRIRKVNAVTGVITTVAGIGVLGFSGDGGPASFASLYSPTGVAVDSSGNIYIVDSGNQRIRKVTATTGVINTIAGNGNVGYSGDGGVATSASFSNPFGLAVDGSRNVYIVDAGNYRIRKVNSFTGVITSVAGNGIYGYSGDGGGATSASLGNFIQWVTVDDSGNVYIADISNQRIRKVSASTGVVTSIAGNGNRGYSGDGGLATSASLFLPAAVVVDGSGNVYIADEYNNRVRKVVLSASGITEFSDLGIIKLYPNPATSNTTIKFPTIVIGKLKIYDLLGRELKSINTNSNTAVIDLSGLKPDVYILRFDGKEQINIGRVIKAE